MRWQPQTDGGLRVEFFGLPGSGKSTIAREVHAILAAADPGLIFAPRMCRDDAGAAVRAVVKLRLIATDFGRGQAGLMARVFAVRQPRLRDRVRAALSLGTALSLDANLQRRGLGAVLDQGMMQALWSIGLLAPDRGADALIARLTREAACSGRVHVSVETPVGVCAARLASRASKHSRLQGVVSDDRVWAAAEDLRRALVEGLRMACQMQGIPPRVITIDGTADPTKTARQVVASLSRAKGRTAWDPLRRSGPILWPDGMTRPPFGNRGTATRNQGTDMTFIEWVE